MAAKFFGNNSRETSCGGGVVLALPRNCCSGRCQNPPFGI